MVISLCALAHNVIAFVFQPGLNSIHRSTSRNLTPQAAFGSLVGSHVLWVKSCQDVDRMYSPGVLDLILHLSASLVCSLKYGIP